MKTNNMWTRTMAVLVALMTAATTWAKVGGTFTVDGVRYIITSESPKEVSVESCDEEMTGALTIPSTVSNPEVEDDDATYKVTSISTPGFYDCKGLTSISIPYGVETIGNNTFNDCIGLTSINIPSSVTSIGQRAFQGCTELTSIDIPSSVTEIGREAFQGCSGLENITIGSGVTKIDKNAFLGCVNVEEIICLADASQLEWNDYQCNDFKDSKATICYVYDPDAYKDKWSKGNTNDVNVTFKTCYDLLIAGTRVTEKNKADILGDGAASYDSETKTLTLNKDINSDMASIIRNHISGLKVVVAANVKLENKATGISGVLLNLYDKTTITGPGVLTLKGYGEYGIYKAAHLSIDNAVINISGANKGIYLKKDGMSIKGGSAVSISSTEIAIDGGSVTNPITLTDSQLSHPEGAEFKNEKFLDANGDECKAIIILPNKDPGVFIDEMIFPDANFREWLLSQDYGNSGYITNAGITGVTEIDVSGKNIADLKGIEYFTALTSLNCSNNQLTTFDVSKNENLQTLNCSNNKLTTLDVSKNTKLKTLDCSNNQLTALDVTKNTALTSLDCYGNQIRGKMMIALVNSLHHNGGNPTLCVYTSKTADGNEMNSIQVGDVTDKGWQVKMWDGSNYVDYAGIHVITIDGTYFPDENFRNWILTQDYADDNYLNDNEIAGVTTIDVSNKGITNLTGIEHFTALKKLNCGQNSLPMLDLSNNKALEELDCSNNQLSALEVTQNTALTHLHCQNNELTTLGLTNNKELIFLDCYDNQIRDEGMDNLINSLQSNEGTLTLCAYAKDDGNEITTTHVATAKTKNWQVKKWDGSKYVDYAGIFAIYIDATNFPDVNFRDCVSDQSIDLNMNGYLTEDEISLVSLLSISSKEIANLKGIEHFTALTSLDCSSNKLTTLDVSNNVELIELFCENNQLTTLDVSKNTKLTSLHCFCNQLATLNVANCTALTSLHCSNNKLTTLNLSDNVGLTELSCEKNQLSTLDVTKNTDLTKLYCHGNQIRGKGMQTLVSSLRQDGVDFYVYSCENDGNKITTEQAMAAAAKGWTPIWWDGNDWVAYNGVLLGDANGDNVVNVTDIVAIVCHMKGSDVEGFSLPAADVDDNDDADNKDIELIRNIIMKK